MTAELVTRLINARDALKSVSPSNEARRAARDAMADAANALSKADQIIAMQSQGREPVGFYCPTYLSRRKEYERNGMVIYDRPLGTSTSPLYAQPDRREVEVLREALRPFAEAADGQDLDPSDDQHNAWESPLAMAVSFGDFRRAAQTLSQADAIAREGQMAKIDPFETARSGGSPRTEIGPVETSTDATTRRESRNEPLILSSVQETKLFSDQLTETLPLFGGDHSTEGTYKSASNARSSATKVRTRVPTLSARLTPSLITAGLVCGTTPSSIRKLSDQPIRVFAFCAPAGPAPGSPRRVFSSSSAPALHPQGASHDRD